MNFFQAQDSARTRTKLLVVLFLLTVSAIVLLIYLATVISLHYFDTNTTAGQSVVWWQGDLFVPVAFATLTLILLGSLFKIFQLSRGGGVAVARMLGARRVERSSSDHLERRLLNVVDEMAIASGVTTPQVFLLEKEQGINAFAAGADVNRAVVAVTRGCLEKLSRDELQGVVAHEFSHIFNGDMRLNIRLMGVLHGILIIAMVGRMLMRGSWRTRSRSSGGAALTGIALLMVGYVGLFFGSLIRAAVSREREFLADASAVQFTRNPTGIAGALKKIAGHDGSLVSHARAEEASHMFFGQGISARLNLFATHPPIDVRIRRLDPTFTAEVIQRPSAGDGAPAAMGLGGGESIAVTPTEFSATVGNSDERHLAFAHQFLERLPSALVSMLAAGDSARLVIYALLVATSREPGAMLSRCLRGSDGARNQDVVALLPPLATAGSAARLPLIELAIPALREMGKDESEEFLCNITRLITDDRRVSLFEYVVDSLLRDALEVSPRGGSRRGYDARGLRDAAALLFSLLAHVGHRGEAIDEAFRQAVALAPLDGPWHLLAVDALSVRRLDDALQRLVQTNFRFRGRLIEACVAAISSNGRVNALEAELLRVIGVRLECPVPPLLAGEMQTSR